MDPTALTQIQTTTIAPWMDGIISPILGEGAMNNPFIAPVILSFLLGAVTYLFRGIPRTIWSLAVRYFTTEVTFTSYERSFGDMLKWLECEGYAKKFRRVQVRNGRYGGDDSNKSVGAGMHWIWHPKSLPWYMRRPIQITVERVAAQATDKEKERLRMRTIGRSHAQIDALIQESSLKTKDANKIGINTYKDYWRFITMQPKRPLDSIIIPNAHKELLVSRIEKFLSSEQWYIDNGIPWHLGIMLEGPPGTGKTSLIKGIAAHLNMGISLIPAHRIYAIGTALDELDTNSIAVIEDVDTAYEVQAREEDQGIDANEVEKVVKELAGKMVASGAPIADVPTGEPTQGSKPKAKEVDDFWKTYGLSTILNSLDGITSAHGRILIMTTNHIEKLDSALLRPGRIDLSLKIDYLNTECFGMLMNRFFPDETMPEGFEVTNKVMPASVQEDVLRGESFSSIVEKYRKKT